MIKSAKFFKIQKPSKTPRNCLCAPDLSSAVAHDGRGTHRRGKAISKVWNSQKKKQQKTGINCVCV
jgi:hypothetical protein